MGANELVGRPVIQHYLSILLVGSGSGVLAWFLLDWIGAFPEDEEL